MENKLVTTSAAHFDEAEQRAFRARMWALLARRARWETMGDSSSLRVEEAEELLRSIAFTLDVYLAHSGEPSDALLTGDLDHMLSEGRRILCDMVIETDALYYAARDSVLFYGNRSLSDTLRSIGFFFSRYNPYSYAHMIPADIDYQLAVPVEESMLGICYIREYLDRLFFENTFLSQFNEVDVRAALRSYYGNYEDPLVNLFEPIAACAIGLSVVGGGIRTLSLDQTQITTLEKRFRAMDDAAFSMLLDAAATDVLTRLNLLTPMAVQYMQKITRSLLPRIRITRQGALAGVFPARSDKTVEPLR